jgi:hypothetical protein
MPSSTETEVVRRVETADDAERVDQGAIDVLEAFCCERQRPGMTSDASLLSVDQPQAEATIRQAELQLSAPKTWGTRWTPIVANVVHWLGAPGAPDALDTNTTSQFRR